MKQLVFTSVYMFPRVVPNPKLFIRFARLYKITIFADDFSLISLYFLMNNLLQRTLSGAVFVAILTSSIWFSPYSFLILFCIITAMALHEYHTITNNHAEINISPLIGVIGGVLLFVCSFLHVSQLTAFPVSVIYAVYVMGVLIAQLFKKEQNPVFNWAYFISGQAMIALPFSLLNHILYVPDWQPIILLSLFVTIWMNDSWAYVFGRLFGKHKLFERVSPKKTWEGFIGGAVMSLLTGVLCWYVMPFIAPNLELSLWQWLLFAEVIVVFGTLGDLMESLLKRTLQIKDSGNVIPGHGGILDRFDSMLLATPAIYILMQLL